MYIHLAGSRGEKNALDRGREVRVDALQALVAVVLQVVPAKRHGVRQRNREVREHCKITVPSE